MSGEVKQQSSTPAENDIQLVALDSLPTTPSETAEAPQSAPEVLEPHDIEPPVQAAPEALSEPYDETSEVGQQLSKEERKAIKAVQKAEEKRIAAEQKRLDQEAKKKAKLDAEDAKLREKQLAHEEKQRQAQAVHQQFLNSPQSVLPPIITRSQLGWIGFTYISLGAGMWAVSQGILEAVGLSSWIYLAVAFTFGILSVTLMRAAYRAHLTHISNIVNFYVQKRVIPVIEENQPLS